MAAPDRPPRLAVVNSHPIQYFTPLYAYLTAAGGLDLTVFYLSDSSLRGATDSGFGQAVKWDIDLLSGYRHEFLGQSWRTVTPAGFSSLASLDVFKAIHQGGFDAVWLHGYAYAADWFALSAAKASGAAVLLRGESHLGLKRIGAKAAVRRAVLEQLFAQCGALLAIGSANRDYYRAYGVPEEKVSLVPYTVDNARFISAANLTAQERAAERALLGVTDPTLPLALFVSKFQRRKHPDAVIAAVAALRREGAQLGLVVAGAGAMDDELKAMAVAQGVPDAAFPGFINQARMPRLLAACDVFVLPSEEEPWGLVVNEAMCAGLPVIVGEKLGCAPDLVRPGENGFTVPAGDAQAIANALRPIISDPAKRMAMGQRSREIIERWSYRECREGLIDALSRIKAREGRRYVLPDMMENV